MDKIIVMAKAEDMELEVSLYDFIYKTGAYVLDSDGLHYDKNARQIKNDLPLACYTNWEYKVYTTESYADVLKHYKSI